MSKRQINTDLYPWSEKDWPSLLHVQVCVRPSNGTVARISYSNTARLQKDTCLMHVNYTSDARKRAPEDLLEVLETMVKQLRRQMDLGKAVSR